MATITKDLINKAATKTTSATKKTKANLWERYIAYAASKNDERVLWYMKAVMVIPCVIMVPTIIAMSMVTENYLWFIGLTIILFYSNITAHIGGAKNTLYIPMYHASIAIMVLLPIIVYLFS